MPTIEGQDYAFTPDTKAITGNYKLIVEPSGNDSLKLYIDGSGTGPTFQKTFLGTFSYANFLGNSNNAAGYVYGVWYLQDNFSAPGNVRVMVERLAYPTKTNFRYRINVGYVYGSASPYQGQYLPYINDVRFITLNDIRQIGQFIFARESRAILN